MGETDKPPENGGGGRHSHPHSHHHHHPPPPSLPPPSSGGQHHHHHHHHHNNNPNGMGYGHSNNQLGPKKCGAWKLIVDPALVKGALKVYRVDGVNPPPPYPIIPRDPRKQKMRPLEPLLYPVPLFKIDANFVGEIPPTEVTFTNLNDNVGEIFLQNLTMKHGMIEDIEIYYHPISHRHLGFGRVVFKNSRDARTCVEKLNLTLLMGKKVNVFHDPGGKRCKELFIEVTTQKPGSSSSSSKDDRKPGVSSAISGSSSASLQKPPLPKSLPYPKSESHHAYKDDNCHHDISSISTLGSDDRKSLSISSTPSSKSSRGKDRDRERERERDRDRDRDRERERERDLRDLDGFRRFNVPYERYEPAAATQSVVTNYGYPVQQPSSSRSLSTPSSSSVSSTSTYHQQNSLPQAPFIQAPVPDSSTSLGHGQQVDRYNSDDEDLSPKIDLDTRIKMMLAGRNSNDFSRLFSDGNISPSGSESGGSDAEPSPLKRARLSLGSASATIWDSESDEESQDKEANFAKKFKQSFVPVDQDTTTSTTPRPNSQDPRSQRRKPLPSSTQDSANYSPPPSPFLSFSQGSSKSVKGKADPEFDQISDDDGQVGGSVLSRVEADKDDMSLSSLSPDPPDFNPRIKQSRFHPPLESTGPPPYYGEYYNNSYPPNPMSHWESSHQTNQFGGPPHHHQFPPPPDYNGAFDSTDSHRGQEDPPEEIVVEKALEDHKNPELLIQAVLDRMVPELLKVLERDCKRRVIEVEAFKLYEDWWTNKEQEYKRKLEEEQAKNQSTNEAPLGDPGQSTLLAGQEKSSIGMGLGFRIIPKLPSFRKKIEEGAEQPRNADSDFELEPSSGSEDEIISKKPKHKFDFSSSDEEESDDDASDISSKSSLPSEAEEVHDVTDAEVISTTEDENEFLDAKIPALDEDEEFNKLPPTPGGRLETEDILSDDDSPEEAGALPDDEQGASLAICDITGRMIYKSAKPPAEPLVVKTPQRVFDKEEVKTPEKVVEAIEMQPTPSKSQVDNEVLDYPIYAKVQFSQTGVSSREEQPASFYNDEDKPLLIPDDVVRPRGQKKSSKPAFRPRVGGEISHICYEFLRDGVDEEDIHYFKLAYQSLVCEQDALYWINATHWVNHCTTVIKRTPTPPPGKKKKKKQKNEPEEGSIRTRGFVRMTKEEKTKAMSGQPVITFDVTGNALNMRNDAGVIKAREAQIREARQYQRRLATSLGTESDLLKFNQLQFRKKALRFARSGIHEWGLFAAEPIAADEMVIEYVGQMIRPVVADLREMKYEAQGIGSSYLFRIDLETIIDATRCGNLSRFINHSCNPNCYAKVITIEGKKKIVIYSKQPIAVSEEITYDYKFPIEDKKIPCLCGTPQCRGTLN